MDTVTEDAKFPFIDGNDESNLPDLVESKDAEIGDAETKKLPVAQLYSRDIATRSQSAEQIARMKYDYLLDAEELREKRLVGASRLNEPASNAFRELRRNVFDSTGISNPIVMVSGVNHGVGTTHVSRNLAAAIALDETSTSLYVDCNITLDRQDDDEQLGLTDFLESKDIEESEIIQQTGIPRLRRIGAGRHRELAGEYFSSPRIRFLFQSVSGRYPDRSVVVDGPPASTDAAILADICDVVLLVVAYGRNTERQIANAISILGQEKIMGFVFNDQPYVPEFEW